MEHAMRREDMADGMERRSWTRWLLLGILAFEAVGAFVGGPALVAAPDGSLMKIPVSELHGVFADFLIPGLLLTGLGLLSAAAFFVVLGRKRSSWLWVGLALGGFLVWFVVELGICGAKSWAQAAWGLPVPIGILVAWPLVRERLRPRHDSPSMQ